MNRKGSAPLNLPKKELTSVPFRYGRVYQQKTPSTPPTWTALSIVSFERLEKKLKLLILAAGEGSCPFI